MDRSLKIETYSRIHITLIGMNVEGYRRNGGIGFSIDGSGFDELGNPVFVPYWNDTKDIELSCRATYDPYHNTISIEPTITAN